MRASNEQRRWVRAEMLAMWKEAVGWRRFFMADWWSLFLDRSHNETDA